MGGGALFERICPPPSLRRHPFLLIAGTCQEPNICVEIEKFICKSGETRIFPGFSGWRTETITFLPEYNICRDIYIYIYI